MNKEELMALVGKCEDNVDSNNKNHVIPFIIKIGGKLVTVDVSKN